MSGNEGSPAFGTRSKSGTPSSSSDKKPSPKRTTTLSEIRAQARKKMQEQNRVSEIYDPEATAMASMDKIRGKTGLCWDDKMTMHKSFDPNHIEKPERLSTIKDRLQDYGLWERCLRLDVPCATDNQLLSLHTEGHLKKLEEILKMDIDQLKKQPVFVNEHSEQAIRLAVGATLKLTRAVLEGEVQNGIALVRPPGHHAGKEEFSGFCLCNNVALAADFALKSGKANRVLIVDHDVHHGQGTMDFFYDNPNVLYLSTHRYEHGMFWPHLRKGNFDAKGEGEGVGFTANLPMNETGCTNSDYMTFVHQIMLPMAHEFQPDLILVSAGYDVAFGDPEGEMRLTPAVFGHIIHELMAFASGKVVVALEGGYFLDSLAEGAVMTTRALLGEFCISLGQLQEPVKECINTTALDFKSVHLQHWNNFQVHDIYESEGHKIDIEYKGSELVGKPHKNYEHKVVVEYKGGELVNMPGVNDDAYFCHSSEAEEGLKRDLAPMKTYYQHRTGRKRDLDQKSLGFIYDEAMMKHANVEFPAHPEQPKRIERIFQKHMEFGLLDRWQEVKLLKSREVLEEEVCLVHDPSHWQKITQELPKMNQSELFEYAETLDSIYLNPHSTNAAKLAAGSILSTVDAVCNEEVERGVAVIRPPGHHAEADEACGFCIFNNVAIAAKYAQVNHGVERILIVDWDVHHGNGIQNMFYETDKVLYVSLHRFDHGTFFPARMDAGADFIGEGKGKGFNVNIPWNSAKIGDTEYALAFYNIILPIAYQYDPQLVLISAGFDAAMGDPLGGCSLTPEMYFHMTHMLTGLAEGKVILALEGGYNLNSIANSMTLCTKAMMKDPAPPLAPYKPPMESALRSVRETARNLESFWPCLKNLTVNLPSNTDNLQVKHNPVETPSGGDSTAASEDSPYIPAEIIQFEATLSVSTLSFNKTSGSALMKEAVDSKAYQEAREAYKLNMDPDDINAKMTSLSVGDVSTDSVTIPAPSTTDYVPFQYGSYPGSSSVFTLSDSSMSSRVKSYTTDSKGAADKA